jgi:hypothetical protein
MSCTGLALLGWHFVDIRAAWDHALVLASLRSGEEGLEARVTKILQLFESRLSTLNATGDGGCGLRSSSRHKVRRHYPTSMKELAQLELRVMRSPELTFERIQLNSPLDLALAVQAAGGAGIVIYALHLLSAVLRDPERVGGWLPRLRAGGRPAAMLRGRARSSETK